MNQEYLSNLVMLLLTKLNEKGIKADSFRIQKVLYKVKMELGETHPFWDSLPYYWYHFGPVSDVVDETVSRYIDDDFEIVDFDESYLKAGEIIDEIIADEDYYFGGIERDIYENFAPFKVMPVFRFKIYEIADKHESVDFDVEKYVKCFDKVNGYLPKGVYFNDFSNLFSGLTILLNILFKYDLFDKNWSKLRHVIKIFWLTFTDGVRVQFHEQYYKVNIEKWDTIFKKNVESLNLKCLKLDRLMDDIEYIPDEKYDENDPLNELFDFSLD